MYLVKTTGRRDDKVPVWNVGGMARVIGIEAAVELAFDVRAEEIRQAQQRTLWTVFA